MDVLLSAFWHCWCAACVQQRLDLLYVLQMHDLCSTPCRDVWRAWVICKVVKTGALRCSQRYSEVL